MTPPDPRDRVATWFRFQNGNGFPHYGHPGGMQTAGHMLALAVEHRYESNLPKTVVLFINMIDPINRRSGAASPSRTRWVTRPAWWRSHNSPTAIT